jgi:hypothetical protein
VNNPQEVAYANEALQNLALGAAITVPGVLEPRRAAVVMREILDRIASSHVSKFGNGLIVMI